MANPQTEPQTMTCHWHPATQTGLSCSQCGRPICTSCLVQAPVGIRCRECGRARPLPTFDVRPANYVRAIIAAAAILVVSVVIWYFVAIYAGYWLASIIMPLATGYGSGELISRAVNLKRSRGLMYIAGGAVVLATLISLVFSWPIAVSLWGILAAGGGVLIAIGRVRL